MRILVHGKSASLVQRLKTVHRNLILRLLHCCLEERDSCCIGERKILERPTKETHADIRRITSSRELEPRSEVKRLICCDCVGRLLRAEQIKFCASGLERSARGSA